MDSNYGHLQSLVNNDSTTDCTEWASADDIHCTDSSQNTFHSGCDAHTGTVVIGHNSLGFTFGGFGQASWQCAPPCSSGYDHDYASEAVGDFLFRLGPGAGPVAYRPTGGDTNYQGRNPGAWPTWGHYGYDLAFGISGALGQGNAYCIQGTTYAGEPNDACGAGNWGATEMEVWYRVGS